LNSKLHVVRAHRQRVNSHRNSCTVSLYVSDVSPLLDSALTQHTLDKMTTNRKIPYVEILVKPRCKRPPSRSSSPTIEPPPKLYRKKRKSSDDHLSDDGMPNMVMIFQTLAFKSYY
jgi:hypothetical protein